MSFVSKGQKSVRNGQKGAGAGADGPAKKDSFGSKGQPKNHNNLPKKGSDSSETDDSVSDATDSGENFNPKKRPGSIQELRYMASRVINGDPTPTDGDPSVGGRGQQDKHGSSKNSSGFMKGGAGGKMESMEHEKPHAKNQDGDEDMDDPMDDDMDEDGEITKVGMTPKGKKRNAKALRKAKETGED